MFHFFCSLPITINNVFAFPRKEIEVRKITQTNNLIMNEYFKSNLLLSSRISKDIFCIEVVDIILRILHFIINQNHFGNNPGLMKGEQRKKIDRIISIMSSYKLTFKEDQDEYGIRLMRLDPYILSNLTLGLWMLWQS
jgi:hypothetical protein